MAYLRFIRDNLRFLGFGFLMTLVSGFGQTFFLGLFNEAWRASLDLSHSGFGITYALATLASALTFMQLGRAVDRVDLRLFTAAICLGLAGACLWMALAPAHILALLVALYLLRLTGQGLSVHAAKTAMVRYFERDRGKALSIASLGVHVAELAMPAMAVALLALLPGATPWRTAWLIFGLGLGVALLPAALCLLRGQADRHARWLADRAADREAESRPEERSAALPGPAQPRPPGTPRPQSRRDSRRGDMLREPRFWLMAPAVVAAPFMLTGVFLNSPQLAAEKGWAMAWIGTGFTVFASANILAALTIGPLIDRFGAARLLPAVLLFMAGGLIFPGLGAAPWLLFPMMAGLGLSNGAVQGAVAALWPELYGTAWVGEIRAFTVAMMILSTAAAPLIFGLAIDAGLRLAELCLIAAPAILATSGMAAAALKIWPPPARELAAKSAPARMARTK